MAFERIKLFLEVLLIRKGDVMSTSALHVVKLQNSVCFKNFFIMDDLLLRLFLVILLFDVVIPR
jgi:hypothetical protein